MGTLIDRVHRELTEADLAKIVNIYRAWRGDSSPDNKVPKTNNSGVTYANVSGYCYSATTKEISSHGYILTPGRYVVAATTPAERTVITVYEPDLARWEPDFKRRKP